MLLTEDESIFKLNPIAGRTWSEKGTKPLLIVSGSKEKIFLFGALDQFGNLQHRRANKQNSDSFIAFLRMLLRIYPKIILVIDRAPWHMSRKTKMFLECYKDRIAIIYLPRYNPESNPTEECWKQIRANVTTNTLFNSKEEMQKRISEFIGKNNFNINLCNYLCL